MDRSCQSASLTYFFMTWRLTLVMSTFWLNSGGNLVVLSNLASTPVAMIADCSGSHLDRRRSSRKYSGFF